MRAFSTLCSSVEGCRASEQRAALAEYFVKTPAEDAAWAVYLLSGRRPKRVVQNADLRTWAAEVTRLPEWLFDESQAAVGDLPETISLLLPDETAVDRPLHDWIESRLLPAQHLPSSATKQSVLEAWRELDCSGRLVWNRWITGSFRTDVTRRNLVDALSDAFEIEPIVLTYRLSSHWEPSAAFFERLTRSDTSDATPCRPYPFGEIEKLPDGPAGLDALDQWQIEWKWSGIRAQVVRRSGRAFIWSDSGDLLTDSFPEVRDSALVLPDGVVLEGEIVAWCDGAAGPFGSLRPRLDRITPSRKLLAAAPVCFVSSDILEYQGRDVRAVQLDERRELMNQALQSCTDALRIQRAPLARAGSWGDVTELHASCRRNFAEGLILKRLDGLYGQRDAARLWWVDPYTVDAVLLYVETGRTRAVPQYSFAVWHGDGLVPVVKVNAALEAEDGEAVDRLVRGHTTERFGPVRAVKPEFVFRIAFDGIRGSSRRRSGLVLRRPRILRRLEKEADQADSLAVLRGLMASLSNDENVASSPTNSRRNYVDRGGSTTTLFSHGSRG